MFEQLSKVIEWPIVSGQPVTVGDITVTPLAQALIIRWPRGGFVWNRPVAVTVEQGGSTQRILILDVTRMIQLSLVGLSLLTAMIFLSRLRKCIPAA